MKKIFILFSLVAILCSCSNVKNDPVVFHIPIATTTGDLYYNGECKNDIEAIKGLYQAGFRNVDLNMYSFTDTHPYMLDTWKESILELKATADSLGMTFVQAHSQGGNPLSNDLSSNEFIVKATLRSIEICEILGIKNTVVHAGIKSGASKEEWFKANKEFYDKLLPTATKCKVNILCENSTSKNTGSNYYINTGKDMKEFINYINHPYFHGCWDTGHGNCESNHINNIKDLGDEMYAIHYNDNPGNSDQHIMLCCGTLPNTSIISTLKEINFNGYFTLECDGSNRNHYTYHGPDFNNNNKYSDISLTNLSRIEQEAWLYKSARYLLGYDGR